MIEINEINTNNDVEVICTPAYEGILEEVIRKKEVMSLRKVSVSEIGNTIKIGFSNGRNLELHHTAIVKVNGVQATDNDDLYDKLKQIFPIFPI